MFCIATVSISDFWSPLSLPLPLYSNGGAFGADFLLFACALLQLEWLYHLLCSLYGLYLCNLYIFFEVYITSALVVDTIVATANSLFCCFGCVNKACTRIYTVKCWKLESLNKWHCAYKKTSSCRTLIQCTATTLAHFSATKKLI